MKELSDEEAANLAFIDNEQRNNLSPFEKAQHFALMKEQYGYTQRRMAEVYNKDDQAINRLLQISKLPKGLASTLRQISENHLYALSKLIDKEKLINAYA